MPIIFDETASGDTTHANHPTLSFSTSGGTVVGRLNHFVDPVFGLTLDQDFYQFMVGTGPGQITSGSYITISFQPTGAADYNVDQFAARVTYRIDSDANLHSTTYYLGSNGTAIRHDASNPTGPYTVTFQFPSTAFNAVEFLIEGYGNGSFAPIDYQITFSGPPTTPDLTISEASASANSVAAGGNLLVLYTLANVGASIADRPYHAIYLSNDQTKSSDDILLDTREHKSINQASANSYSSDITLPANHVPGLCYLIIEVDSGNTVNEWNEGNNTWVIPITITGGVSGSSTLYVGDARNQKFDVHSTTGASVPNSGAGDDFVWTGTTADLVYGGAGRDVILGNAGDDMLFGDTDFLADNDASGASGAADQIVGGTGRDFIYAGAGNDYVNGEGDNDVVFGQNGNDLIYGGLGNDSIFGGTGDDQLWGGTDTTLQGSWFGSPISVNSDGTTDSAITAELHSETGQVQSTSTGNDLIFGGPGNDTIYGQDGNDLLYGESGNDTINGGAGTDNMVGGAGNDTYFVDNVGDVVAENASEGIDTVYANFNYALGADVEQLYLQEGSGPLTGVGNGEQNLLVGNSQDNVLDGGSNNDTLQGGVGNDTLFGGAGTDGMIGGTGNDTYFVDSVFDVIVENAGEGIDTVYSNSNYIIGTNVEQLYLQESGGTATGVGNGAQNLIVGNSFDNVLDGGSNNDQLEGGGGNDTLEGGTGTDGMIGGTGNDTYFVDSVFDVIVENAGGGIDTVYTNSNYIIGANVEQLYLMESAGTATGVGNGEQNLLVGNSFNNALDGGSNNDTLRGGGGDDTLFGGAGIDGLYGEAGNDHFVFNPGTAAGDVIVDFAGNGAAAGDRLSFVGFGAGATFTQQESHSLGPYL